MPHHRFHGWFVAAAAAMVLLFRLGGPALWDDDEPKNAACSLAMLDAGDWVVPTFNGRLRIEKPALVNWVHMAGYALCGRNETGARIGSAVLTIGTCLLTWRIGCLLLGPAVGLLGGLAMATCVWTAVGGRAATPDAPLAFCTTLALFLYVSGTCGAGRSVRHDAGGGLPDLPWQWAVGCGAACGAATLAKGPIGLVMPAAALLLFATWCWRCRPEIGWFTTVRRLRLPTITAATAVVALPWYALVSLRTDGAWLHGFLFVHNVGRFAAPMEGHAGSFLYYPGVLAVGLFPWSIVLAAMAAHAAAILRSPAADDRRRPVALLACWAVAWIGGFSCAGTKLPGYIWPAYPAVAIATGLFLSDWAAGRVAFLRWCRDPERAAELVMRVAWSVLGLAGVAFAIGLPVAAARLAPGSEWLGALGLIPLAAAAAAWHCQTAGRRDRALAIMAVASCLLVAVLASKGAESFSRAQGPRALVSQLAVPPRDCHWACLWNVPPSLVFYTGARIETLDTPADITAHLARQPLARVVIDSRQEAVVTALLPPGCGVLARVSTLADHDYLLLGPLPAAKDSLACNDLPAPQDSFTD